MKKLILPLAAICAALIIRFLSRDQAIPAMGDNTHIPSRSLTVSDLADDLFERSAEK